MLLRNIIETMVNIISNNFYEWKINLYSGHETNVASLLFALDNKQRLVPAYGSAIFFELLTDNNNFYIKVNNPVM